MRFLCLVFFALSACIASVKGHSSKLNIVLLVSDDQRPDTIGALGNPHIQTPHLDSLVRDGTAFTRAIAANPICTPSRGELLTGCTGFRNGVLDFGGAFRPGTPLWPETMRQAGYATWYVGKWHNHGHPHQAGYKATKGLFTGGGAPKQQGPNLDRRGKEVTGYRGWTFKTDDGKVDLEKGIGLTSDISRHFADAAIEFIKESTKAPFFLHVNFTAPHDPLIMPSGYGGRYKPEEIPLPANFLPWHPFDHGNFEGRDEQLLSWPRLPEQVREELAVYYSVITHMDDEIGRILRALDASGKASNTLLVFTSDHGLALGSHGLMGKQNMYEHTLNVPLLFKGPTIPKQNRISAQCYLRDLFPTICELAGIPVPNAVQGRSLMPLLTGDQRSLYPETFAYFRDSQRMIRTEDDWKLVYYPKIERHQLFHIKSDPHELNDLADAQEHSSIKQRLGDRMKQWFASQGDPLFSAP